MEDINEKSLKRDRVDSTGSSDSQHTQSSSSDVGVESMKFPEILVTHKILPQETHLAVKFIINTGQRPDTLLPGDVQGDHTTSYIAIIGSMLAAVDDIGIRAAVKTMSDFGEKIFEKEKDTLSVIKTLVSPKVHERGQRKLLKGMLDKQATLAPDSKVLKTDETKTSPLSTTKTKPLQVEQILFELKYAKVSLLANYLCDLSTVILSSLQKQPLTAFFSKGRDGKNTAEGANTKSAARALFTLNLFCKLLNKKDTTEKNQKLVDRIIKSLQPKQKASSDTEEDHVLRYGLNALQALTKKSDSDENKTIPEFLKKMVTPKTTEKITINNLQDDIRKIFQVVESNLNVLAEFINNLFDYQHEIKFKEIPKETLKEYFNEDDHNFITVDDTKKIYIVQRTNIEELVEVLNRHLLFIELAFPELYSYLNKSNISPLPSSVGVDTSKSVYEHVRESFLSLVLEKQGWKNQDYQSSPGVFSKIDVNYLLKQLSSSKKTLPAPIIIPGLKPDDALREDMSTKFET